MADPLGGRPPYSDPITPESAAISNIPISDFRRNEARPIITDDGNTRRSFVHFPPIRIDSRRSTQIDLSPADFVDVYSERSPQATTSTSALTDGTVGDVIRSAVHLGHQRLGANRYARAFAARHTRSLCRLENPSARVQFLLGDEDQDDDDEEHKPHDLFIELNELVTDREKLNEAGEPIDQGWKETARYGSVEREQTPRTRVSIQLGQIRRGRRKRRPMEQTSRGHPLAPLPTGTTKLHLQGQHHPRHARRAAASHRR